MAEGKEDLQGLIKFVRSRDAGIPIEFLKEWYILTNTSVGWVTASDCATFLRIRTTTLYRTIRASHVHRVVEISAEEDAQLRKFPVPPKQNVGNQKYYKMPLETFKDICQMSRSAQGGVSRKYYRALEEMVKEYHRQEMIRLRKAVASLSENMKPKKLAKTDITYVFRDPLTGYFKIGKAGNGRKRMATHNTSHPDNLEVVYQIETCCRAELENMVHVLLDDFRYRNEREFFTCDLPHIKKVMKIAHKTLMKHVARCA